MIYADANVIILLIEGDAATRGPIETRLAPLLGTRWQLRKTATVAR
jgi:hypothetical protein